MERKRTNAYQTTLSNQLFQVGYDEFDKRLLLFTLSYLAPVYSTFSLSAKVSACQKELGNSYIP
ncbi:MAG: hypothetical protein ACRCZZ_09340 [Phocaeicola sp.]